MVIRRWHLVVGAGAAALLAVYGSLLPLHFDAQSAERIADRWDALTVWRAMVLRDRADLLANFVLFVPIGFLLAGAGDSRRHGRWAVVGWAPAAMAIAAVMIIAIEIVQIYVPLRTISLNDMLAELAGSAAGVVLWLVMGRAIVDWLSAWSREQNAAGLTRRLCYAYMVLLVIAALLPLDVAISGAAWEAKRELGRLILVPFAWAFGTPVSWAAAATKGVVMWMPIGLAAAVGWLGVRRGILGAAAVTGLMSAVLELLQLPIHSAVTDVTQPLLAAIGGAAGAAMVGRIFGEDGAFRLGESWSDRTRQAVMLVVGGAMAVVIAALLLRPWSFDWRWSVFVNRMQWFPAWPFQNWYFAGEWVMLSKATALVVLAMPLGLIARWGACRCGGMRGRFAMLLGLALAFGVAIEMGQAWVVARYVEPHPDQTHAGQVYFYPAGQSGESPRRLVLEGPMPDATDALLIMAGVGLGWGVMGVLAAEGRSEGAMANAGMTNDEWRNCV